MPTAGPARSSRGGRGFLGAYDQSRGCVGGDSEFQIRGGCPCAASPRPPHRAGDARTQQVFGHRLPAVLLPALTVAPSLAGHFPPGPGSLGRTGRRNVPPRPYGQLPERLQGVLTPVYRLGIWSTHPPVPAPCAAEVGVDALFVPRRLHRHVARAVGADEHARELGGPAPAAGWLPLRSAVESLLKAGEPLVREDRGATRIGSPEASSTDLDRRPSRVLSSSTRCPSRAGLRRRRSRVAGVQKLRRTRGRGGGDGHRERFRRLSAGGGRGVVAGAALGGRGGLGAGGGGAGEAAGRRGVAPYAVTGGAGAGNGAEHEGERAVRRS